MKDRTSENNPQRTDDKNSISFKNRQKNIMKEDIPVLQRRVEKWQSKGDTVTKSAKADHSSHLHFQSENFLVE